MELSKGLVGLADYKELYKEIGPENNLDSYAQPPPIHFDFGPTVNITPEAAQNRAEKHSYAVGGAIPADQLANQISNGEEGNYRQLNAEQKDVEDQSIRLDMMSKAARSITPDEFPFLDAVAAATKSDPNTVIEREYAKKMFSDLYYTTEDGIYTSARQQNSIQASVLEDHAQELMVRNEVLRRTEEDLNLQKSQRSVLGAIGDFVETIIPFKSWYNLENSLTKTPNAPFLLGNNLAEGVRWANQLTPEEYARVVPQAIQAVADVNPNDAQTLIDALRAYSLSDQAWGNFQSLNDLSVLGDVAGIGVGVGRSALRSGVRAVGKEAGQTGFDAAVNRMRSAEEVFGPQPRGVNTGELHTTPTPDSPIDVPYERKTMRPGNRNAAFGQEGKQYIKTNKVKGPDNFVKPGQKVAANDNVGALKDSVKTVVDTAATQSKNDIPEIMSAAGKTDDAVLNQARNEIRNSAPDLSNGVDDTIVRAQRQDFVKNLPLYSNPLDAGNFALDREVLARLKDRLYGSFGKMLTGLSDFQSLERLSAQQQEIALRVAQEQIKRDYPSVSNAIHGVDWLSGEFNPENIHRVQFTFKRPDGTAFSSPEKAEHFATAEAGLKDNYSVVPVGNGYAVQVTRAVDETNPSIRSAVIEPEFQTPSGFGRAGVGGNIRTANDLLGAGQNAVRKALVHGIQKPQELLYEAARPIRALSNPSRKNFIRFTEMMRDYVSPKGQRGIAFRTQGDFETAWQSSFGRLPTEKETEAYWAYQNINDWDYVSRNLLLYRQKARLGVEDVEFTGPNNVKIQTEARIRDDLKLSSLEKSAGVYYFDPAKKTSTYFLARDIPSPVKTQLDDLMNNEGYKLVQLTNPYSFPMKDATGEGRVINFVLTKDYKRSPLKFEQIPYNPGGHVIYDEDHWIKQPRFIQTGNGKVYVGDTTIRPAATGKLAKEFADKYEQARLLLKDKKLPELADFVKKNLFEDLNEFLDNFNEGRLDVNVPITNVSRIEKTTSNPQFKARLGDFQDALNDPYNDAGRFGLEFLGDKNLDVQAIYSTGLGSDSNPLVAIRNPRLIDPLSSLERATANLANSQFLQDYRTLSAENFVREFSDILRRDTDKALINPVSTLMDKNPFRPDADPIRIAAARNYQNRVLDLIGTRTEAQKQVESIKEKLYNTVYNRFGEKTADFLDDNLLSKELNPVFAFRKAAFAMKLGLFNPLQLFKQSQTLANVFALSPTHAAQAFPVYPLTRTLMLTSGSDQMIDHAAGIAAKFGWSKENFKEWFKEYARSGLNDIRGEHAYKDRLNDVSVFRGTVGRFLDKSKIGPVIRNHTFFFDEGERTHRVVGSATAYLEWRRANPTKTLDRRAWQGIMLRQDNLTQNMTKASNAAWQKGVWTIPTQFASYQIRFWEQMMGGRISRTQKMRILATQAALYGVPIGILGSLAPVYPFYEDIRQNRLAHEAPTDDLLVQSYHNGVVSAMMQLVTGNEYATGEAFGPTPLTQFKDMVYGDKTTLEILSGAAGSTFSDVIGATLPVLSDAVSIFRDGAGEGNKRVFAQDMLTLARNVSSVNYATKLIYSINMGKYVTKNGLLLNDNTTTWDSIMMAMGVDNMAIGDEFKMLSYQKEIDQVKNEQRNAYAKAMNNYWAAIRDGESEDIRMAYWKKAQEAIILGGFQPNEFSSLLSYAAKGNTSLMDTVNRKFLIDKAPAEDYKARMERYISNSERNN